MLLPPELHPFIFNLLNVRVKRLINKKTCEACALEYGLAVNFNWELISYYFDELQYPLMISKTYNGIFVGRLEQMIYVVYEEEDLYITFNIRELPISKDYSGKQYRYSDTIEYHMDCFEIFQKECIRDYLPIKSEFEHDILRQEGNYDIDLDNMKVILTILGCGRYIKEILLKEVHTEYQKEHSVRKRLWFELNSSRLIDNFWDYYDQCELLTIAYSDEKEMKKNIEELYLSIVEDF